jgi:L-amino acid N-acyltransferase YncA
MPVADDWQHLGRARRLMHCLMRIAADAGLRRMVGDVLAANSASDTPATAARY